MVKVGGGIIPVMADVLFGLLGKRQSRRSQAALCIRNVGLGEETGDGSCMLL